MMAAVPRAPRTAATLQPSPGSAGPKEPPSDRRMSMDHDGEELAKIPDSTEPEWQSAAAYLEAFPAMGTLPVSPSRAGSAPPAHGSTPLSAATATATVTVTGLPGLQSLIEARPIRIVYFRTLFMPVPAILWLHFSVCVVVVVLSNFLARGKYSTISIEALLGECGYSILFNVTKFSSQSFIMQAFLGPIPEWQRTLLIAASVTFLLLLDVMNVILEPRSLVRLFAFVPPTAMIQLPESIAAHLNMQGIRSISIVLTFVNFIFLYRGLFFRQQRRMRARGRNPDRGPANALTANEGHHDMDQDSTKGQPHRAPGAIDASSSLLPTEQDLRMARQEDVEVETVRRRRRNKDTEEGDDSEEHAQHQNKLSNKKSKRFSIGGKDPPAGHKHVPRPRPHRTSLTPQPESRQASTLLTADGSALPDSVHGYYSQSDGAQLSDLFPHRNANDSDREHDDRESPQPHRSDLPVSIDQGESSIRQPRLPAHSAVTGLTSLDQLGFLNPGSVNLAEIHELKVNDWKMALPQKSTNKKITHAASPMHPSATGPLGTQSPPSQIPVDAPPAAGNHFTESRGSWTVTAPGRKNSTATLTPSIPHYNEASVDHKHGDYPQEGIMHSQIHATGLQSHVEHDPSESAPEEGAAHDFKDHHHAQNETLESSKTSSHHNRRRSERVMLAAMDCLGWLFWFFIVFLGGSYLWIPSNTRIGQALSNKATVGALLGAGLLVLAGIALGPMFWLYYRLFKKTPAEYRRASLQVLGRPLPVFFAIIMGWPSVDASTSSLNLFVVLQSFIKDATPLITTLSVAIYWLIVSFLGMSAVNVARKFLRWSYVPTAFIFVLPVLIIDQAVDVVFFALSAKQNQSIVSILLFVSFLFKNAFRDHWRVFTRFLIIPYIPKGPFRKRLKRYVNAAPAGSQAVQLPKESRHMRKKISKRIMALMRIRIEKLRTDFYYMISIMVKIPMVALILLASETSFSSSDFATRWFVRLNSDNPATLFGWFASIQIGGMFVSRLFSSVVLAYEWKDAWQSLIYCYHPDRKRSKGKGGCWEKKKPNAVAPRQLLGSGSDASGTELSADPKAELAQREAELLRKSVWTRGVRIALLRKWVLAPSLFPIAETLTIFDRIQYRGIQSNFRARGKPGVPGSPTAVAASSVSSSDNNLAPGSSIFDSQILATGSTSDLNGVGSTANVHAGTKEQGQLLRAAVMANGGAGRKSIQADSHSSHRAAYLTSHPLSVDHAEQETLARRPKYNINLSLSETRDRLSRPRPSSVAWLGEDAPKLADDGTIDLEELEQADAIRYANTPEWLQAMDIYLFTAEHDVRTLMRRYMFYMIVTEIGTLIFTVAK